MKTRLFTPFILLMAASYSCAQGMPTVLRDANAVSSEDWAKAQPILRDAIECRAPLRPNRAVLAAFRLTNTVIDGDHQLPAPLTVFGVLKVDNISIFQGNEEEGTSYSVQLTGVTMAQVARAAKLNKDGGRYVRMVQGGMLEVSKPRPGTVELSCIRGGYSE